MAINRYKEKWDVQRHDHDSGYISYGVWCTKPFTRLFVISEHDNKAAKAIAENIIAQHNEAANMLEALRAAYKRITQPLRMSQTEAVYDVHGYNEITAQLRAAIAKAEAHT